MSADEKRRKAQRQVQIAAYEAKQASDLLNHIDDVKTQTIKVKQALAEAAAIADGKPWVRHDFLPCSQATSGCCFLAQDLQVCRHAC